MRPASINLFEKLYLAAIALGIVEVVFGWSGLVAEARARLPQAREMAETVAATSAVVGILISLLLWFFVVRRPSVIAKWIVVLFAAISLYSLLGAVVAGGSSAMRIALGFAGTVLQVFAAWLLFKPDAKAWLESRGAEGPSDPTTFE